MIEELLYWPVEDEKVLKLGQRVEEIDRDFSQIDFSLTKLVPNKPFADDVQRQIDFQLKKARKIKPQKAFDQLVADEFIDHLYTQGEYVRFFFNDQYNKEWGVRGFLNYLFLHEDDFFDKPGRGALDYLEKKAKNIDWQTIARRDKMIFEMSSTAPYLNPADFEDLLLEQIPRLRKMVEKYNVDMGFVSSVQADAQSVIEIQKEQERLLSRVRSFFGNSTFVADFIRSQDEKYKGLFQISKKHREDRSLDYLIYDLVITDGEAASYDSHNQQMEINSERFLFYRDQNNGRIKLFTGDIDRTIGHENFHRLQQVFSRHMIPGLTSHNNGYNISSFTMCEGEAMTFEENFMSWLSRDENRRQFGLTKKDIHIANLGNEEYVAKKLIKLLHAAYHRELSSAEGKTDYEAHERLAKVFSNPALADEYYLDDESLHEVFYHTHYIFGQKYLRRTLAELEERETRRLGSKLEARNFLDRNEPILLQGLMTGSWGWGCHDQFFLDHYWPKAQEYCT